VSKADNFLVASPQNPPHLSGSGRHCEKQKNRKDEQMHHPLKHRRAAGAQPRFQESPNGIRRLATLKKAKRLVEAQKNQYLYSIRGLNTSLRGGQGGWSGIMLFVVLFVGKTACPKLQITKAESLAELEGSVPAIPPLPWRRSFQPQGRMDSASKSARSTC
jgi:hypothetical protein